MRRRLFAPQPELAGYEMKDADDPLGSFSCPQKAVTGGCTYA